MAEDLFEFTIVKGFLGDMKTALTVGDEVWFDLAMRTVYFFRDTDKPIYVSLNGVRQDDTFCGVKSRAETLPFRILFEALTGLKMVENLETPQRKIARRYVRFRLEQP